MRHHQFLFHLLCCSGDALLPGKRLLLPGDFALNVPLHLSNSIILDVPSHLDELVQLSLFLLFIAVSGAKLLHLVVSNRANNGFDRFP